MQTPNGTFKWEHEATLLQVSSMSRAGRTCRALQSFVAGWLQMFTSDASDIRLVQQLPSHSLLVAAAAMHALDKIPPRSMWGLSLL